MVKVIVTIIHFQQMCDWASVDLGPILLELEDYVQIPDLFVILFHQTISLFNQDTLLNVWITHTREAVLLHATCSSIIMFLSEVGLLLSLLQSCH